MATARSMILLLAVSSSLLLSSSTSASSSFSSSPVSPTLCFVLPPHQELQVVQRQRRRQRRGSTDAPQAGNNNNNVSDEDKDAASSLLESATRLRREAEELEQRLRKESRQTKSSGSASRERLIPTSYSNLSDSTWTLQYRFKTDVNDNEDDDESEQKRPQYYSGKTTIFLREDGYTLCQDDEEEEDSTSSEKPQQRLRFLKYWGWDEEVSQEDGERYLLFSVDADWGEQDLVRRFYFQARVVPDERGVLTLTEGSVTIKKEITAPANAWWANLFRGGDGILAQFRVVGEFLAKPVQRSSE